MTKKIIIPILTILLFVTSVNRIFAQSFDVWLNIQKIKPLVSKKEDADKLFSRKSKEQTTGADGSESYELKQGELSVHISDGICRKNDWDVPKGTVLYMHFFFNKKHIWKFKDFVEKNKIDLSRFNRKSQPIIGSTDKLIDYELPDGSLLFSTVNDIYLSQISISAPDGYENPRCKITENSSK